MNYSLDKIIPNVEGITLNYPLLDNIAWYSLMENLHRIMPERREVVMDKCVLCGQKCERICKQGEAVAWNWSQARFRKASEWN